MSRPRNPPAKLHRPVTALRRLQDLAGAIENAAANDRSCDRLERTVRLCREAFEVAFAALNGGPLPGHEESPRNFVLGG